MGDPGYSGKGASRNPDLDERVAGGTPTSRLWGDIWPLTQDRNTHPEGSRGKAVGLLRLRECVGDFRDWSASSLNSAYDYSRAPTETFRNLLQGELVAPTIQKKLLVSNGYVFAGDHPREEPPHKRPTVGMRKSLVGGETK